MRPEPRRTPGRPRSADACPPERGVSCGVSPGVRPACSSASVMNASNHDAISGCSSTTAGRRWPSTGRGSNSSPSSNSLVCWPTLASPPTARHLVAEDPYRGQSAVGRRHRLVALHQRGEQRGPASSGIGIRNAGCAPNFAVRIAAPTTPPSVQHHGEPVRHALRPRDAGVARPPSCGRRPTPPCSRPAAPRGGRRRRRGRPPGRRRNAAP